MDGRPISGLADSVNEVINFCDQIVRGDFAQAVAMYQCVELTQECVELVGRRCSGAARLVEW
jgi:hypothetical protein